jgi:acid phosphatase
LSDVVNNPAQQANVVPFTQFAGDLAGNTLPDYAFIVPDDLNNGHDCPGGDSNCPVAVDVAVMDNWLQNNLSPLIDSSAFQQGGLLMITFDESEQNDVQNGGGHVPFVIAGPRVKPGYVSNTFFQHASVLRLCLEVLGIGSFPGSAATATDMGEFLH